MIYLLSNLWSYYWQPDERNHDFPSLAKFLHELSQRHFSKIVSDSSHPFFSRVSFNNCWMSSRNKTIYKTGRCRTQRRAKSFFPFFMSERNRWFFIIFLYFCFNLLVNIRYYRFCDRECEIKLNFLSLIFRYSIHIGVIFPRFMTRQLHTNFHSHQ